MASQLALQKTYSQAREVFLQAATSAGATVETFVHPLTGPSGEQLSIDVAELGNPNASDAVLVVSGTHGVEGYCGSALQSQWLRECSTSSLGNKRVVLVHGFNPYGFAWVRRVNEDNVDLNRNFINWNGSLPKNDEYTSIAELIVPRENSEVEQQRTIGELLRIAGEWGMDRMQAVVSGGQYEHSTGVFYGGNGPVWSHKWMREWTAQAFTGVQHLSVIDLHTGLGPSGYGELISHVSNVDAEYERATAMWGEVRSMVDGESVSATLTGDWLGVTEELWPHAEVTAVALEFGTVDPISVLLALRADAWLHGYGDPRSESAVAVRNQVRAAFADDHPEWIEKCWRRFSSVMSGCDK
jgi:hypothetical protein